MSVTRAKFSVPPNPTSNTKARVYFWRAAILYVVFNAVISPMQYWSDLLYGWRYGEPSALILPFVQGSVFFYSIVLNSDTIFRAIHNAAITTEKFNIKIMMTILASVTLLHFTFQDYNEVTRAVLQKHASSFPIADQVIFLAAALGVGFFMNHLITETEIGGHP
jgi:hypothetical protein